MSRIVVSLRINQQENGHLILVLAWRQEEPRLYVRKMVKI